MHTPTPDAEVARLKALHALAVLDTAPERRFDRIVELARETFDASMAAITLVDADRVWIKAGLGLGHGTEAPRGEMFCHYAIQGDTALVVPDAAADERFRANPLVLGAERVRFYAGHPVHAPAGDRVGTLWVTDTEARHFGAEEQELLAGLASEVERELARGNALQAADPPRQSWAAVPTAHIEGYDIASRCASAQQAAGGFSGWAGSYGRLHLRVADVVGHPLPTSLVTDAVEALLPPSSGGTVDAHDPGWTPPKPLAGSFITAFAGRLDVDTGRLTYVHTGYGLAAVLAPDGSHRWLASSHPPLGVAVEVPRPPRTDTIAPGEVLMVLSDGYLAMSALPGPAAGRSLAGIRARYRDPLTVNDAVELATAWTAAEGHPEDLTVLAVGRAPS